MLGPFLTAAYQVQPPGELRVDAEFPGGNIVVDRIEGDEVYVHQDIRDTEGDWFYWYFRVQGAAGRTIRVHFTGSNPIGVRGPAVSTNGARTWYWLGADSVTGHSFRFEVPPEAAEVRFCFAMPYLEANLREFLTPRAGNPHLSVETLCQTAKGRFVEKLRLGRLDGAAQHRVVVTARHHCCEMMASYVLEGLMAAVLDDTEVGWRLRSNVEFLVIPFVDRDGVEDGDQGKNRRPHDHNRDYAGESLYPTVRAIRQLLPQWSAGKLRLALDLHCPHIRGPHNEVIYFVGSPEETIWARATHFAEILEAVRDGPLPYFVKDNLPFGQGWNTEANLGPGKSFCRWAAELPGIDFATTIEIPYANANGVAVTADSAQGFARDLARAIDRYLGAR